MSGSGRSQELEYLFPNLVGSGYEITGETSDQYNCIAWALGITTEKWNSEDPADYWPPSLPRNNRVETVMRLFAAEGFSLCDDDMLEPGYEKIALYAFVGRSYHVARQMPDGRWTSKLGRREVITHLSPDNLVRSIYGEVHCIMRRPSR